MQYLHMIYVSRVEEPGSECRGAIATRTDTLWLELRSLQLCARLRRALVYIA